MSGLCFPTQSIVQSSAPSGHVPRKHIVSMSNTGSQKKPVSTWSLGVPLHLASKLREIASTLTEAPPPTQKLQVWLPSFGITATFSVLVTRPNPLIECVELWSFTLHSIHSERMGQSQSLSLLDEKGSSLALPSPFLSITLLPATRFFIPADRT